MAKLAAEANAPRVHFATLLDRNRMRHTIRKGLEDCRRVDVDQLRVSIYL